MVELITERIETLLGESVDRHVNDAFSYNQFDGNIDTQDKIAQKICNDIIKTKELDFYLFKCLDFNLHFIKFEIQERKLEYD